MHQDRDADLPEQEAPERITAAAHAPPSANSYRIQVHGLALNLDPGVTSDLPSFLFLILPLKLTERM